VAARGDRAAGAGPRSCRADRTRTNWERLISDLQEEKEARERFCETLPAGARPPDIARLLERISEEERRHSASWSGFRAQHRPVVLDRARDPDRDSEAPQIAV